MRRRYWRYGSLYKYKPRSHLVKRLAKELNITEEKVREKIEKESSFLRKNNGAIPG